MMPITDLFIQGKDDKNLTRSQISNKETTTAHFYSVPQ